MKSLRNYEWIYINIFPTEMILWTVLPILWDVSELNQWLNLGKDKKNTHKLLAACHTRSAKCLSLRICGRPATLRIVIKRRGYCTLHLQPVCNLVACNDARRAWVFVSGIINLDECQRGTLPSLRVTSLNVSLSTEYSWLLLLERPTALVSAKFTYPRLYFAIYPCD